MHNGYSRFWKSLPPQTVVPEKHEPQKITSKNIYKRFGEHVSGTIMERLPPEA